MWGTGYGASWMTGHPGAFGQLDDDARQADRRSDRLAAAATAAT